MLNKTEKQKIKMFLADKLTKDAVKKVLRESFIKAKDGDIHMKAAQMMAVNLLEECFKELKKYSNKAEQEIKEVTQVGL